MGLGLSGELHLKLLVVLLLDLEHVQVPPAEPPDPHLDERTGSGWVQALRVKGPPGAYTLYTYIVYVLYIYVAGQGTAWSIHT